MTTSDQAPGPMDLSPALTRRRRMLGRIKPALDLVARVTRRRATPAAEPRLIQVPLLWGIGDAVLALPLIQALRRRWPRARIEILGKPWLEALLAGEGVEVRVVDAPWTRFVGKYRFWDPSWRIFIETLLGLRREPADLWVNLRLDPRDAILARLARARWVVGYRAAGGAAWIDQDLGPSFDAYQVTFAGALAAAAGRALTGIDVPGRPRFSTRLAAQPGMADDARCDEGPYVVLAPGASSAIRRLDPDHVAVIARDLVARGLRVILVDDGLGPVAAEIPSVTVWRGDLGALRALIDGAAGFAGAESGPFHIAVASGIPIAAGIASGHWRHFVDPADDPAMIGTRDLACRPCFDRCAFARPLCRDGIDPVAIARGLAPAGLIADEA